MTHYTNRMVAWSDDLATSVDQIDAHNQSLLAAFNTLFATDVPCEGQSPMCQKIEDTIVYLSRIFRCEEAMMDESGDPDLESHRNAHRALLGELMRLQRTLECGRYDTGAMFELLSSWTLAHIETWDKDLGDRVRANSVLSTRFLTPPMPFARAPVVHISACTEVH